MKIRVTKRFDENRAPEIIETGIYDESDQRLFGLAVYLIDNGNAVIYSEPKIEVNETILPATDKSKRGKQ